MAKMKLHQSDRERICRICEKPIEKNLTSIVIEECKVSNRKVNIHFHYDCIFQSLEKLQEDFEELKNSLRGKIEDFKDF